MLSPPEMLPAARWQAGSRPKRQAAGPARYKRCFESFVNSLCPRAQILQKFA